MFVLTVSILSGASFLFWGADFVVFILATFGNCASLVIGTDEFPAENETDKKIFFFQI